MPVESNAAAAEIAAVQRGGHVVCTIGEGHYFQGVAALVNSLVHAGFAGTVAVGYRGDPPGWLNRFAPGATPKSYIITRDVILQLIVIDGAWHLNNCKPDFIRRVLFDLYRQADLVYYFDTDVVVKGRWQTLADWASSGIVVVLDVADTFMPPEHVYRREWQALAARQNRQCRRFTGYVNGGCVGIARKFAGLAEVWSLLMAQLEADGTDMTEMKSKTGKPEYSRMDQDVLNATLMATELPVNLLGPEAMGMFPWVGEIIPHAMFHKKPWIRNYILDALRGFPPSHIHRAYWQFVDGPIRPFAPGELVFKRLQLRIARLIGFAHSRSHRDM
jgi:hypothetical protein